MRNTSTSASNTKHTKEDLGGNLHSQRKIGKPSVQQQYTVTSQNQRSNPLPTTSSIPGTTTNKATRAAEKRSPFPSDFAGYLGSGSGLSFGGERGGGSEDGGEYGKERLEQNGLDHQRTNSNSKTALKALFTGIKSTSDDQTVSAPLMGPPDFPFPRSPQAQKQPHLNRTRFVEKGGIASAIGPKRKSALAMTRSHSHEGTVTITNSPQTPQQQRHSRLLLVSLLENFCTLYANESSPELTQNLFRVLCGQLQRWGIIEPEDFGDEVYALRGGVKRAFRELVVRAMEVVRTGGSTGLDNAGSTSGPGRLPGGSNTSFQGSLTAGAAKEKPRHLNHAPNRSNSLDDMPFGLTPPTEIPPNSNPSPRPTSFFNSHLPPHLTDLSPPLWDTRTSRYTDDFVQLQPLGHGAFGHVYKVRNRLDGVEYAVKKIKIRLGGNTAAGRLDRILREVKFQARLAHPNIVRYYSAWVEEDLSPRVEGGESDEESESGSLSHSYHYGQSNGSGELALYNQDQSRLYRPNQHQQGITSFVDELMDEDLSAACVPKEQWDESAGGIVFGYDEDDEMEESPCSKVSSPKVLRVNTATSRECANDDDDDSVSSSGSDSSENSGGGFFVTNKAYYADMNDEGDDSDEHRDDDWDDLSPPRATSPTSPTVDNASSSPASLASSIPQLNPPQPKDLTHPQLTLFIQMELCNQTLQSYLQRRNVQKTPQVHLPTVRRIFRDIVLGVAVIHAMGCVHRDVNPRNVYWKEAEGVWKVGDFGLVAGGDAANDTADNGRAGGLMNDMFGNRNVFDNSTNAGPDGRSAPKPARRRRGSTSSNADGIVGTVTYASPEQRQHMIPRNIHHHPSKAAGRNTIPTPASDIYSLGIILYELLQPFSTAMERSRSLATLRAGLIPERFIERYPVEAGWIFCMMRTDPRARPGAAEVVEWIDEVIGYHHHHPFNNYLHNPTMNNNNQFLQHHHPRYSHYSHQSQQYQLGYYPPPAPSVPVPILKRSKSPASSPPTPPADQADSSHSYQHHHWEDSQDISDQMGQSFTSIPEYARGPFLASYPPATPLPEPPRSAQSPTASPTVGGGGQHSPTLASQNKALKARVHELEKRLKELGVAL